MKETENFLNSINTIEYEEIICQIAKNCLNNYKIEDKFLESCLMVRGKQEYIHLLEKEGVVDRIKLEKHLSKTFEPIIAKFLAEEEENQVIKSCSDIVKRKCRFFKIPEKDCDEILSKVLFTYARKRKEGFKPDISWHAFLAKVTQNEINHYLKNKGKKENKCEIKKEYIEKEVVEEIFMLDEFPGITKTTFIYTMLYCLPQLSRDDIELIDMYFFRNMSYRDIAKSLPGGHDHKWVAKRIRKILKIFRAKIEKIIEEKLQ